MFPPSGACGLSQRLLKLATAVGRPTGASKAGFTAAAAKTRGPRPWWPRCLRDPNEDYLDDPTTPRHQESPSSPENQSRSHPSLVRQTVRGGEWIRRVPFASTRHESLSGFLSHDNRRTLKPSALVRRTRVVVRNTAPGRFRSSHLHPPQGCAGTGVKDDARGGNASSALLRCGLWACKRPTVWPGMEAVGRGRLAPWMERAGRIFGPGVRSQETGIRKQESGVT